MSAAPGRHARTVAVSPRAAPRPRPPTTPPPTRSARSKEEPPPTSPRCAPRDPPRSTRCSPAGIACLSAPSAIGSRSRSMRSPASATRPCRGCTGTPTSPRPRTRRARSSGRSSRCACSAASTRTCRANAGSPHHAVRETRGRKFLRENFVLYWSSERPVPRVTIDYGDGRKLERTTTGNSAHYVLDAAGRVIDVLPGLYAPAVFRGELTRSVQLAQRVRGLGDAQRARAISDHHRRERDAAAQRLASVAGTPFMRGRGRLLGRGEVDASAVSRAQRATIASAVGAGLVKIGIDAARSPRATCSRGPSWADGVGHLRRERGAVILDSRSRASSRTSTTPPRDAAPAELDAMLARSSRASSPTPRSTISCCPRRSRRALAAPELRDFDRLTREYATFPTPRAMRARAPPDRFTGPRRWSRVR